MCHYIKIVLPPDAEVGALREVMKRHGRLLEPISERLLDLELGPGERAYLTTGSCDCGTGLAPRSDTGRHDDQPTLARLRRAGWSETKVKRWLEQRGSVATQRAVVEERSRAQDVDLWREVLTDLLDAKTDHVGIVVHDVTASVRRGPTHPRARLTTETVGALEENVLYVFTRRPA